MMRELAAGIERNRVTGGDLPRSLLLPICLWLVSRAELERILYTLRANAACLAVYMGADRIAVVANGTVE